MATAAQRYPSSFLAAADVKDGPKVLTIAGVRVGEVGHDREEKVILSFEESNKELVLNKTNWFGVASATGQDDDDNWTGYKIELRMERVQYSGKYVPALRVNPNPVDAVSDQDIPF